MTATQTRIAPSAASPIALPREHAASWLTKAGALWLITALAGQMIFALYTALIYGGVLIGGGAESWNRSPAKAYVPGDTIGNLMFGLHALLAVVIIVGGALQLVPQIRRHLPAFHRWTGRTYMVAAAILALGGIALILMRGTVGNWVMQLGTSLNGVVIVICAAIAWTYARRKRFDLHRRWALRLFLAVSGVWFFRVGLMLWLIIFKAPVGFDPNTFTGPFLVALTYGQFILPLAVLEVYFRIQDRGRNGAKLAMTGLLLVLTVMTAGGIFGATMGMWLPRI